MTITAILTLASSLAVPAMPPAPAATVETPAEVAAKAARKLVKTAPAIKDRKDPAWLAAELAAVRALGQHGRVSVEGIIGLDGRFTDLRIRTSSRGTELDALVLKVAAALSFVPARDGAGRPLAIWALYPLNFDVLNENIAMTMTYSCEAAVRDWTWWRNAWPESSAGKYVTYNVFTGLELMQASPADRADPARFRARMDSFPQRWDKAMITCRTTPTRPFVVALGEGRPA